MVRLNCQYQGFKIALRVADAFALQADVKNEIDVAALHAIKNVVNTVGLSRELGVWSVNGLSYTSQGGIR